MAITAEDRRSIKDDVGEVMAIHMKHLNGQMASINESIKDLQHNGCVKGAVNETKIDNIISKGRTAGGVAGGFSGVISSFVLGILYWLIELKK